MSSKLEQALHQAVASIPECLAAGYVDLTTGLLLGIRTVDSHPNEVLELLAAATADMFEGPNVTMIEKMFKIHRGSADDGRHYFNEMIVNSENMVHILLRGKRNEQHVAGFVCRKSVNLGMAISKSRSALPMVEACV
jgi:hypothetical protein